MNKRTIVIAEVGVNHDGSIEKAKKLILIAKKCDADYVKFQFFHAKKLVLNNCDLAEYQKRNSKKEKNQLSLLKKLEFNENTILKLKEFAKKKGIKFFCSAFSEDDIPFLNKINEVFFKIPSGEINNIFILDKVSNLKKKLIVSTGASSLNEISKTISYLKSKIKKDFNKKVILMHCVSKYPTKINELNLNFIKTLKKKFKVNVGFSDHTTSVDTGLISVMQGAEFVEKHITLNNNSKGPDHKASLNPKNFKLYVKKIRQLKYVKKITQLKEVLGSSDKKLTSEEIKNKKVIRKSLVAKQDIKLGEIFSSKNLTAKRPGHGKSPMQFLKLIGTRAKKDIKKNQMI